MSSIAFYAPMKSPNHPIPSGDRAVAQALLQALENKAKLVSSLRIYDGKGDKNVQSDLITQAASEADKLIKQGHAESWKLWFTYHNYYKAPDLIGPTVSKALGIPYVLLEATRAKKRLDGPWSTFAKLAEKASDHADLILYFTQQDRQALEAYRCKAQQITHLPPFLTDTNTLPARSKPNDNILLSVGMMRKGAKTKSYALIAQTLGALENTNWHLNIVGDGPARTEVAAMFAPFAKRITYLGQLNTSDLANCYANAAVFFWPGVDEAFGMVYLEAQAAGLPVVAQDRPGLRDVISPTTNLSSVDDIGEMAQAIDQLFNHTEHWQARSQAGQEHVKQNHLITSARKNLMTALTPMLGSN